MTSLTNLNPDLFKIITVGLDHTSLMRLASTCKYAKSIVINDFSGWKRIAERQGIPLDRVESAFVQVRDWQRLSLRAERAYEEGRRRGDALLSKIERVFIGVCGIATVVAAPLDQIASGRLHDVHLNQLLLVQNFVYPTLTLTFYVSHLLRKEYPRFDRVFNVWRAAIGVTTLVKGVACLSILKLPVAGLVMTSSGCFLLAQVRFSRFSLADTAGVLKGKYNMLAVRTSACAHRVMRTSFCERVTHKMTSLKSALFNLLKKVAR